MLYGYADLVETEEKFKKDVASPHPNIPADY
jgi:hypothetical protein